MESKSRASGWKDDAARFDVQSLLEGRVERGLCDLPDLQSVCCEYFRERQYKHHETPERTSILAAVSRIQYLLADGRKALAGKFSLGDFVRLLDAMQGDFFSPRTLAHPVAPIADTFGWQSHSDIPLEARPLVATLEALAPLERAALADVLERLWHVEMPNHNRLDEELLMSMGVAPKVTQVPERRSS